jgi:hypothetical protein
VPYGTVVEAMDAAKGGGVERIGIITGERAPGRGANGSLQTEADRAGSALIAALMRKA